MSTIALVDDDHNILSSVSVVLEAESYRVITYSDGFSALKGFTASAPDLAILDINMSRMDGMELLRRLRQQFDLPMIFLSSRKEEMDELAEVELDDVVHQMSAGKHIYIPVGAVHRVRALGSEPLVFSRSPSWRDFGRGRYRPHV